MMQNTIAILHPTRVLVSFLVSTLWNISGAHSLDQVTWQLARAPGSIVPRLKPHTLST